MTVQRWCENPVNGGPWVVLESDYDALLADRDRLRGLLTRMLQWDQFNPPMTGDHAWWKQQIRDALAGAADQPAAALGDWRPISEAPADGIWALVYAGGAINCAYVQAGKLPEDWTEPACPNVVPEDVTHWMPLPRHPATADNSGPAT